MELDEVVVINIDAGKIRMSSDAIQAANNLPWRKQMFEQLTKVMEAMDGVGNDPDREVCE